MGFRECVHSRGSRVLLPEMPVASRDPVSMRVGPPPLSCLRREPGKEHGRGLQASSSRTLGSSQSSAPALSSFFSFPLGSLRFGIPQESRPSLHCKPWKSGLGLRDCVRRDPVRKVALLSAEAQFVLCVCGGVGVDVGWGWAGSPHQPPLRPAETLAEPGREPGLPLNSGP